MDKIVTMRPNYLFFVLFQFVLFGSCNFSDNSKDLGSEYFFRNEGESTRDILCRKPSGGEIPATVLSYDFDSNFIIAKQKPKIPQDQLYHVEYEYKYGDENIYYWLILKKEDIVIGPLNLEEFNYQKQIYKVPNKLVLK